MGLKISFLSKYLEYAQGVWKNRTSYIQWILLFSFEDQKGPPYSFSKYQRIKPPKDRHWADPFVILRDDKYYIFIEELIFKKKKGVISVIELDRQGKYTESKVVIEEDYHMSYPFLFEENGVLYMIPETGENETVQLYKCIDFPLRWEFQEILLENIKTADSTLFKHKGMYWLFTNEKVVEGAKNWDILNLYFSKGLSNQEWIAHPLNPVVSDIESSRPAGAVFNYKGRIYRPGQNCSKHYGYGIKIKEITKLSSTEYEESEVQSVEPNWASDLVSIHTLNFDCNIIVADTLIKRRKWFWQ